MSGILRLALALSMPLLSACVSLTADPRALLLQPDRSVRVQSLPCNAPTVAGQRDQPADATAALDPTSIRVLTWNIHKEGDAGWEDDLRQFVSQSDIVLLQEVVLQDPLRRVIEDSGLAWVMASSFLYREMDIGVLTAARVTFQSSCTQRVVEPLIRLPKSAVISWFRIAGSPAMLAVVNVHAINFSLSIETYTAQFAALGDALAAHTGPIVFAGDFNTWTDGRSEAVAATARKLGLTAVVFQQDKRSLFLGRQLDHLFVRGLDAIEVSAIPVKSSDHNPVVATLRLRSDAR